MDSAGIEAPAFTVEDSASIFLHLQHSASIKSSSHILDLRDSGKVRTTLHLSILLDLDYMKGS